MLIKAFKFLLLCLLVCFCSQAAKAEDYPIGVYLTHWEHEYKLYYGMDTCGFNQVVVWVAPNDNLESIRNAHLKDVAWNAWVGEGQNPAEVVPIYYYSDGHYFKWEAEANPGLTWKSLKHYGGLIETVGDTTSVHWRVNQDASGLVIDGPGYYQESGSIYEGQGKGALEYTARFRMKVNSNSGSDTVATIKVISGSSHVLDERILFANDFMSSNSYQFFELGYPIHFDGLNCCNQPDSNHTEFKVYWQKKKDLWLDRIEVYDGRGLSIINTPQNVVTNIHNEAAQFQNDTVVVLWYLRDQPLSLDNHYTYRFVDSVLYAGGYKRGTTAYCHSVAYPIFPPPTRVFVQNAKPRNFMYDYYPIDKGMIQRRGFQGALDTLCANLDSTQNIILGSDSTEGFYYVPQAHGFVKYDTLGNPDTILYDPTPNQLECITNLGLVYGADGLYYYTYESATDTNVLTGEFSRTFGLVGYHDQGFQKTEKWYKIRDRIIPRLEKLGPIVKALTWQGAGECHNVSSIPGSFIDTLKSAEFDPAWVEAGFFKDASDTNYFMLVNRRCLSTEAQNITISIDSTKTWVHSKMWYVIDQYSHDTTFTGAINGSIPFTTHLDPGEGKLFKLSPFSGSAFHGTAHPLTW
jgi:hypothetical protein